jgi:hypothetical protein
MSASTNAAFHSSEAGPEDDGFWLKYMTVPQSIPAPIMMMVMTHHLSVRRLHAI